MFPDKTHGYPDVRKQWGWKGTAFVPQACSDIVVSDLLWYIVEELSD